MPAEQKRGPENRVGFERDVIGLGGRGIVQSLVEQAVTFFVAAEDGLGLPLQHLLACRQRGELRGLRNRFGQLAQNLFGAPAVEQDLRVKEEEFPAVDFVAAFFGKRRTAFALELGALKLPRLQVGARTLKEGVQAFAGLIRAATQQQNERRDPKHLSAAGGWKGVSVRSAVQGHEFAADRRAKLAAQNRETARISGEKHFAEV